MRTTRRRFLETAVGGGLALGGAGLGFLSRLRPVSADEAKLDPALLRLDTGIESTVRLLEETPREKLIEEVAGRVHKGLSYRELLAALLVAGVRNVQPRPQVGFKFHAVLVINSAHLASQSSPDGDRWLPIFWSLDRFKSAQLETQHDSGWRMGAVDEPKVPSARKAREAFIAAMDAWDEPAADVAAAGLARTVGRDEAFEIFCRYGARDWRDIGHKAIYVANSFRTLDAIGWQHAEPVLRSLAYALLKYDGANPAKSDHDADRPWRKNADLAKKVNPDWLDGKPSTESASHLLGMFRNASSDEAAAAAVAALNDGVAPASIWDSMLSGAGELLMRRTNILSLHAVTTTNALRYAYEASGNTESRLMMLLQAAAFLPLFRGATEGGGKLPDLKVDELKPEKPKADGPAAVAEIFADASHDRMTAARKTLAFLDDRQDARSLMNAARRLVFFKGNDAHDYKFSSAVLEDYYHVSPVWRNRFLASSLFYLPGSEQPDTPLVGRIQAALGGA